MLHKVRKQKYGAKYYKRTKSVLGLDRQIHVPNDVPETQSIAEKVKGFVQTLVELVSDKHQELDILKVKMFGSFTNDTKVGDIDEFNFVCFVPSYIPTTLTRYATSGYRGIEKFGIVGPAVFYKTVKAILQPSMQNPGRNDVHVQDVFQYGDRTFVVIAWCCPRNHPHKITFDLVMACEMKTTLRDEIKTREHLKDSWLKGVIHYLEDEKVTLIVACNQSLPVTSSVYEKAIHKYLIRASNGRSNSLIRCLKFLSSIVFPEVVFKSKSSSKGYTRRPYVDSYIINRIVFTKWTEMNLESVRLIMKESFGLSYPRDANEPWLVVKDTVTREKLRTSLVNLKHIVHDDVIEVFDSSIFEENNLIEVKVDTISNAPNEVNTAKSYFRVRGRYHEAGAIADYCLDAPMCLYTIPDTQYMLFYRHNLVQELIMYRQTKIISEIGVNLSLVTKPEFYSKWNDYCSKKIEYDEFQMEYNTNI